MSITIRNRMSEWLKVHPNLKQWLWFIALWCLGLFSVLMLAYPIKLVIKNMG